MEQNPAPVPREILARYADYDEQSRLSNTRSVGFEFLRSQELILRHTQTPPKKCWTWEAAQAFTFYGWHL